MKRRITTLLLIATLLSKLALAQEGVVVRASEAEPLLNGIYLLLSPNVGTNGAMLAEQRFQPGGQTIVHAHDQGDELFYVVTGRGRARLGDKYEIVGPGDAILIAPGQTHQISNPFDEELIVVFYMATPELAEQFRALHERQLAAPARPITETEDAEFTRRFGGSRTILE